MNLRDNRPTLEFFRIATDSKLRVNLVDDIEVHAGFPSPVEDAYMAQPIDLNSELIKNPASTFLVRVAGNSMINEGVDDGDMLVVDRALFPSERHLTIVAYEGEFALKRVVQRHGKILLLAGNDDYPPIEVTDPERLTIWGVVRWVMKKKS